MDCSCCRPVRQVSRECGESGESLPAPFLLALWFVGRRRPGRQQVRCQFSSLFFPSRHLLPALCERALLSARRYQSTVIIVIISNPSLFLQVKFFEIFFTFFLSSLSFSASSWSSGWRESRECTCNSPPLPPR